MASQQVTKKLIKHLDEGVAMEQNVLRMLDSMIKTTQDPETLKALEQHKHTTRTHAERLEQRLKEHGSSPSRTRRVGGIVAARIKGAADVARRDKPGRNARDGFVAEQLEIASYELLERVAQRAGDDATAEVARQNRAEDQAMAQRLADDWDKFAELSLAETASSGGGGKASAIRDRVTQVGSTAVQNPLVVGAGTVAAGFVIGRRFQKSGGGGQQKQSAQPENLELMTKKELQERAEAQGISVSRSMKKQELVDALRSH